ncbi:AraC family transcriptional regulator [Paenibacillus sp. MDMC362]|uniref:helix-turn-helix transcriptional regulator n=1 Tax=Paenibacillus sp. MDMC362 TaxID=2977365 RepID=UPI000DC5BA1C|nr:AraC family transcriptional regulator [Paenibacillus sp. MDMC362]RAR41574.1 AraC family transcriptional regulator [Paenibacillus sp. MDMC362]
MLCLEFAIPPLPQSVTAGHAVWKPGDSHFARTFGVYDLLLVTKGTLYMREEQTEYVVGPGKLLLLEAGLRHVGHRACLEHTEIYWVHFIHEHPAVHILQEDIPWTSLLSKGTVEDVEPSSQQRMYLPKFASIEVQTVEPMLRGLNDTHNGLNGENALQLHLLLTELFAALQAGCARTSEPEPSVRLAQAAAAYLNEHWREPFERASLEEKLHFQASYIARCMKRHIGKTPLQYVLHLRLEEAKKLLGGTVLGISEIAERVGIRDSNYMTRLFTAKLGMPPGAYRQMLRQKKEGGGDASLGHPS